MAEEVNLSSAAIPAPISPIRLGGISIAQGSPASAGSPGGGEKLLSTNSAKEGGRSPRSPRLKRTLSPRTFFKKRQNTESMVDATSTAPGPMNSFDMAASVGDTVSDEKTVDGRWRSPRMAVRVPSTTDDSNDFVRLKAHSMAGERSLEEKESVEFVENPPPKPARNSSMSRNSGRDSESPRWEITAGEGSGSSSGSIGDLSGRGRNSRIERSTSATCENNPFYMHLLLQEKNTK